MRIAQRQLKQVSNRANLGLASNHGAPLEN